MKSFLIFVILVKKIGIDIGTHRKKEREREGERWRERNMS